MALVAGQTVSHYKIVEKLGEGGMGVVYKARDLKLDRFVALKFLPQSLTSNEAEEARFLQEARAASALNHPHICAIHSLGEHEGQQFIDMELIEGKTLRETLPVKSIDAAVAYAIQIGEALQEAHSKEIIHRDVKSDNIMVNARGEVKVMDFGLAKLKGALKLTRTSSTVGTMAYMAPEQIQGESADARSDIFSFGVVLYEMLTGHLPFRGEHQAAVMYSILNEEPQPIQSYLPEVPPELMHVVNRALEKDPAERYQTVQEMVIDLRRLRKETTAAVQRPALPGRRGGRRFSKRAMRIAFGVGAVVLVIVATIFLFPRKSAGAGPKSLAVLPFTNLQKDPDRDYLGFALADQIIGDLSYLKDFNVRASSLVRRYQGQPVDPVSAGRELQTDYVLAGSYLIQGNLIRLSVELLDTRTGELIWRQPAVEEEFKDAFKLQDLVSEKVIQGLRVQFSDAERTNMQKDVPGNPVAYEYYLRARSYPLTEEGHRLAIQMLQKSIELDSTFSPSFTELGYRVRVLSQSTDGRDVPGPTAEIYLLKAVALNGTSLQALGELASAYVEIGKSDEAFDLLRKALQINPNDADARFDLGYLLRYAGLFEEAEVQQLHACRLSPGNPRFRSLGATYYYQAKYDSALRAFDLDAGTPYTYSWKSEVCRAAGRRELALAFADSLERTGTDEGRTSARYQRAVSTVNKQEILALMPTRDLPPSLDAEAIYQTVVKPYGLIGEAAACARYFRVTVEKGFFCYPYMVRDPDLDPVRSSPGVQEVLALAKAKHEEFKKKWSGLAL
jgi:eukaryotic-like serine/threonine-protein kinase